MEYVKIGQLVDLKQGIAINAKSNHLISKDETNIALLRIADMPTKRKVIYMKEETPERYIANKNDIIYTRTGQVGLVFTGQHGVVHNNCFRVFSKNDNILSNEYLYWCLRLKSVYIQANNFAVGSAQPDLPHTSFRKIRIPLFSINAQNKIAKILQKYDDLIEKNNRKIAILEEQIQELYKEWFVRFRFPGYEKVKFVNGLPIDWEYKRLREMAQYYRGLSYSSEEIDTDSGVDLVNLNNIISYGGFNKNGTKKYAGKYKETQTLKDSDLVMGVTDMTQERRLVGSVALVDTKGVKTAFSADLIKLISSVNKLFLYCMLKYGNYSKYIAEFANGANVLHLKPDSVMNVKVLMPSEELINKFAMSVENYFNNIKQIKELNDILLKQRDLLLPRLMSGKLKV